MRKLMPLLALAFLAFPPAPADAAGKCFPKRATRVVANTEARVYAVPDPDLGQAVYGCFKQSGRTTMLGEIGDAGVDEEYVEHVRLNGHMVVAVNGCVCRDYSARPQRLAATDLRRGRLRHSARYEIESRISDAVVSRSGSTALIVTHPPRGLARTSFAPQPDRRTREVRAIDGRSVTTPGRLLDSGLDIEEDSLGLRGSTLAWEKGGVRRVARLR